MRIEGRGQRAAVWGVAAAMFVILMLITPKIPQDQKYHQFADKRNFYGELIDRFWSPCGDRVGGTMFSCLTPETCSAVVGILHLICTCSRVTCDSTNIKRCSSSTSAIICSREMLFYAV